MDRRSGLFALVVTASALAFVGTLHLVFFAAPRIGHSNNDFVSCVVRRAS